MISAESETELRNRLGRWKRELENKGLRVNVGKKKVSCYDTGSLKDFGKHPCGVSRKGVGHNSIY